MNKIGAKIVADSISQEGYRITTMVLKFPRYILAELNTHRAISKNSASSRAKPFKTMLKSVQEDPFIPVAWMKDHSGMQGNSFFTDWTDIAQLEGAWLQARTLAVQQAEDLSDMGLTKQIVNRVLEPFLWHEVLVTSTEWENFFGLRCPQYEVNDVSPDDQCFSSCIVRSRKDAIDIRPELAELSDIEWRLRNKGMADIHIMDLAEAVWDAYNTSEPNELDHKQWHLPYVDTIDIVNLIFTLIDAGEFSCDAYFDDPRIDNEIVLPYLLKISAARCARISYKTFGEDSKIDILADMKLHDNLLVSQPIHASPAEHQGRAMDEDELLNNYVCEDGEHRIGTSRNFVGFVQYRTLLNNETMR